MAGNQQISYICCSPLKRESIVRMMTVNQKNTSSGQQRQSVSLVMVSAKGRVAVYDMSLKLATAFTLRLSSAPVASIKAPLSIPSAASRTSGSSAGPNATTSSTGIIYNAGSSQKKMQLNGWITDCIHMDEFNSLVVASSGRCLHFFTTVVTPFVERFRLDGMKDIPTSLAYLAPAVGAVRAEPLLGVGDDAGDVFVLRFLKASTSLFKKREADGEIQHVYWRELHLQAGMVTLSIMPGCHESPVLQVYLKRTMLRVVSCSKSSSTSLLIRHLRPQSGGVETSVAIPSVTLRTAPGVTCFDYDDDRGLVVTGSTDGKIRMWSPTHLAKPWMVLTGHSATIAAICLVKQSDFLWSLSDQAELRYWDLNHGKCLNTIHLTFRTGNKKDRVQFSQKPLLASKHVLYVACADSVATVQLSQSSQNGQGSRTVEALLGRANEEESEETGMGAESKIPYRFREDLLDFGYHAEDDVFNKFITDLKKVFADSVTASERLKEVEKAGVKSLAKSSGEETEPVYDWEMELAKEPPTATKLVPLNQIKLKELEGKKDMKKHVKDGTPFCGLRLHEPSQIELPKCLPVTGRMKKHGIKSLSSLREVREANFDLFSDQMLSLSSARTSLLSSVLSYYKKKRVGDKVTPAGDSDLLMVSPRSQHSSRKSSVSSNLSPYSSGASMEE